jgi:hypothetical protein
MIISTMVEIDEAAGQLQVYRFGLHRSTGRLHRGRPTFRLQHCQPQFQRREEILSNVNTSTMKMKIRDSQHVANATT